MIEHEHPEICTLDDTNDPHGERRFKQSCIEEYNRMMKEHPLVTDPLPKAAPKAQRTHRLEYDPCTKEYTPVPIIQQYERDSTGGERT